MKKFNIFYKVNNQRIEKKDLTWKEVNEFLDSLGQTDEHELKVIRVKDEEEEER